MRTFCNFVRYIRILDSCHLLKTNVRIWKVNAGFVYQGNYKEKYKTNNKNHIINCYIIVEYSADNSV